MKAQTIAVLALIAAAALSTSAAVPPPVHIKNQAPDALIPHSAPAYPLKLSANRRYLVDQNSVPFLLVGDSPQALMSNLSLAEADRYFANRQAHGFNAVGWINVVSARPCYPASHADGSTYDGIRPFTAFLPGGSDYAHYDLTKPNGVYFARLDRMLALAAKHGIVVFLNPMETINWLPTLRQNGLVACTAYGKYLGKRYRHVPNIVWLSGNDFNSWKQHPGDDALVQAVAKGIASVDTQHLQTVELFLDPSTQDPTWRPIIAMNGVYTYAATYLQMLEAYNQCPVMPAYLLEAHYELERVGVPTDMGTPSVLRRQGYWAMLCGGAGQIYGNAYTWTFKPGWEKHLDTPGAAQLTLWKKFFTALPWYELVPDQSHTVVTAGWGTPGDQRTRVSHSDYLAAARTPDGRVVVAYMPSARPITVNMARLKGPARARWFDPTGGAYTIVPGSPIANRGHHEFVPPGKNRAGDSDWVLVLDATSGNRASATSHRANRPNRSPVSGPLRASQNPRYFADASGHPLILCGSHSWNTLQDWGTDGAPQPVDFADFVRFLQVHGHNFTLLWCTELPKIHGLPSTAIAPPDFTVRPFPWARTGPGRATDGGLKFDLTRFDPAFFTRLHARVAALNQAGIYAGVYLFTGEFLLRFRSATDGYPFSGPNNVNGVDDGYRGGPADTGLASVTMTSPNRITRLQDAYVRKTIDTLNDFPNVLWIVSEEAPSHSVWWNRHLIHLIRAYERTKRYQHPIGFATLAEPSDSLLYNSDADWVAPSARISPERSCGNGYPRCKVNINDSDHSYFGMWNDSAQMNRNYAWENFLRGNQVLFMDPYLVYYPRENRNRCVDPRHGIGRAPDPRWENFRNSLGKLLEYSRKLDLARVNPRSSLCSTHYCLAQTPTVGAEYLVYAPTGGRFTVDLSAMSRTRRLTVEWFNPATGETTFASPIPAGSPARSFRPPFLGDAVLYLVDTAGHR